MGLYRTFISLIFFSLMGLSFIHIIQVNDMELNKRLHPSDYLQNNRSQAHTNSIFKTGYVDRGHGDISTQTSDTGRRTFTEHGNSARLGAHVTHVNFTALTSRMYVFGVYLDPRYRPMLFLRIMILLQGHNLTERLACGVEGEIFNAWAERYEMCENHGKLYGGWIYSCTIPHSRRPNLKSVVLSVYNFEGSLISSQEFPIVFLETDMMPTRISLSLENDTKAFRSDRASRSTKDHIVTITDHFDQTSRERKNVSIGVCVPPLHGNLYIPSLIHFLEMSWLLGANKVFLYNFNVPLDQLDTLRKSFGERSSQFEIVNWDLPAEIKSKTYQVIWNNGQLLAVQHCLYQNMADFAWILFLDIDEMLIPRKVYKWQHMLQTILLGSKVEIAALTFESAFFTQGFDSQRNKPIKYFQHLHRTMRTSGHYSKLLVRPKMAFEVGIHHLSRPVHDSMRVIKVHSDAALLHHYRVCEKRDDEPIQCDLLVKDTEALKYESQMTTKRNYVNIRSYFLL